MNPSFIILGVLVAAVLAVVTRNTGKKKARERRAALEAAWGRPTDVERDSPLIASYHQALASRGAPVLDERTGRDLDLDAVFAFIDRTQTAVGRQVLYHRLRSTAGKPETLAQFEAIVEAVRRDDTMRGDVQMALGDLHANSVYWLWALVLEPIEPLPSTAVVYPAFAGVMALLIVLTAAFRGPFLMFPVLGLLVGGALRAGFGRRLVPLAESFRDMVRLVAVAQRLSRVRNLPPGVAETLAARLPKLVRLRRAAGWIGRNAANSADLGSFVVEYVNLVFCVDGNAALLGVRELRRHQDDLREVFETVGLLDAAVAVASVRAGTRSARETGTPADDRVLVWTRPEFAGNGAGLRIDGLCHPLLETPVPNSLALGPPAGLLVTGANMTGKSTFLRAVGVNVVLAQTICTAFATGYRGPWLFVGSCITPADDLQSGRSYYQAEVETLVAMLKANDSSGARSGREDGEPEHPDAVPLYLFDELFRGTNTLDRIGAATAVLEYLGRRAFVLAATHDLELVSLLTSDYSVVHFADRLDAGGLQFDYLLRPGPTTTRNAIALLGVLGAPPDVVSAALDLSERLRNGRRPD